MKYKDASSPAALDAIAQGCTTVARGGDALLAEYRAPTAPRYGFIPGTIAVASGGGGTTLAPAGPAVQNFPSMVTVTPDDARRLLGVNAPPYTLTDQRIDALTVRLAKAEATIVILEKAVAFLSSQLRIPQKPAPSAAPSPPPQPPAEHPLHRAIRQSSSQK
jgi:hypothetical protein